MIRGLDNLARLADIEVAQFNKEKSILTLIGPAANEGQELTYDDWLTVFRSIAFKGGPGVSIDPGPNTDFMEVRYFGGIEQTHLGFIFFEADRMLKVLGTGHDNLDCSSVLSLPSNMPTELELLAGEVRRSRGLLAVGWHRFWFEPTDDNVETVASGLAIRLPQKRLIVKEQSLSPGGGAGPTSAKEFAALITANFDQLAETIPSFAKLHRQAGLVAVAKWMVDKAVLIDQAWLDSAPNPVETERTTPAITVTRCAIEDRIYTRVGLYGGVDFRKANSYKLQEEVINQLSATAETAGRSEVTVWDFDFGGRRYCAVRLRYDTPVQLRPVGEAWDTPPIPHVSMPAPYVLSFPSLEEIAHEVGNSTKSFRPLAPDADIVIRGAAYVWDLTKNSVDEAFKLLPEKLRAGSDSGQLTVFVIHQRGQIEVGRYTISNQPAYRENLQVLVTYWPEGTRLGSVRFDGGDPPSVRPVQYIPGYGASVKLAEWISGLRVQRPSVGEMQQRRLRGRISAKDFETYVGTLFNESDRKTRSEAAVTLAKSGDAGRVVRKLIAELAKESHGELRSPEVEALELIGAPSVLPLLELLKNPNGLLRWRAVEALGNIGDARAVDALAELSRSDPDQTVRQAAMSALAKLRNNKQSSSLSVPHWRSPADRTRTVASPAQSSGLDTSTQGKRRSLDGPPEAVRQTHESEDNFVLEVVPNLPHKIPDAYAEGLWVSSVPIGLDVLAFPKSFKGAQHEYVGKVWNGESAAPYHLGITPLYARLKNGFYDVVVFHPPLTKVNQTFYPVPRGRWVETIGQGCPFVGPYTLFAVRGTYFWVDSRTIEIKDKLETFIAFFQRQDKQFTYLLDELPKEPSFEFTMIDHLRDFSNFAGLPRGGVPESLIEGAVGLLRRGGVFGWEIWPEKYVRIEITGRSNSFLLHHKFTFPAYGKLTEWPEYRLVQGVPLPVEWSQREVSLVDGAVTRPRPTTEPSSARTESAKGPQLIALRFRDGAEVTVRDWFFKYVFLESDSPIPPVTPSGVQQELKARLSKDLHLNKVERSIRSHAVVPGGEIRSIRFKWEVVGDGEVIDRIIISRKDGTEESFDSTTFQPSDEFLSEKGYLALRSIHVVGKVQQNGTTGQLDYDLHSYFGTNQGAILRDKKDMLEELLFR